MSWAETLGLPANLSAFLYYRLRTVTQIDELHPRLRKKKRPYGGFRDVDVFASN